MLIENEFRATAPVEELWAFLLDVERIAPCMPGAQLTEVEGDEYRGTVKIKVGPITAQYKGKATFLSKDDANHVAVLKAEGRDTKGQGNASATITATLKTAGSGTDVVVSTDLTITGKVAQFGRGVMVDVSGKLMAQFADNLNTMIDEQGMEQASAEAAASATTVATRAVPPQAAQAARALAAAETVAVSVPVVGTLGPLS